MVKKRIQRNGRLVRASWMALFRYRMLLLYPVVSTIAAAIVAGYVPLALVRARIAEENAMFALSPKGILGALILYFATCTTVQFFNVMLAADAVARLDGPYRRRLMGWRVAVRRFPAILAYSVLSSSLVSVPVEVACKVARWVGIRSLPEPGSWSLATFLGVPIIAVEGLGARAAMARSEALLRSVWSDRFVGGTGVDVARRSVLVATFVGGLGLLILVAPIDYDPATVAMAVLWLAVFFFLCVTGSAVGTIYCTATYRHCVGRPVPGFEALNEIAGATPTGEVPPEAVHSGAAAR